MERTIHSMQDLYAAFIGEKNELYYLSKFEEFDQTGRIFSPSWNWPAFFFTWGWLAYRKMYGLAFLIAFLTLPFIVLSNFLEGGGHFGLSVISWFIPYVLIGTFANSMYHQRVIGRIEYATKTLPDETRMFQYLRENGGVNSKVAWGLASIPLVGIAAAIIFSSIYAGSHRPQQQTVFQPVMPPPIQSAQPSSQTPRPISVGDEEMARFQSAAQVAIAKYPFLDIKSPGRHDQAIADVVWLRDKLIKEGQPPHEALRMATEYFGQAVLNGQYNSQWRDSAR